MARTAIRVSAGRTREDLWADEILSLALTRCLEIIGEAASKLSLETRERFPIVPYTQMVTMRNRLVHAYFDINLDIVWETVTEDLPTLLTHVEAALRSLESD